MKRWPGWAAVAADSGYFFSWKIAGGYREDPSDQRLTPPTTYARDGRLYWWDSDVIRVSERDGHAWRSVFYYDRPQDVMPMAIDPASDRVVVWDVVDMPMLPWHHVVDLRTGESQRVWLRPAAIYLFAPDDWLGRLIGWPGHRVR